MESIWKDSIKLPDYDKLKYDIQTDVLVIGGGITGILCAYMLKNSGVDCVVAEADKICSGTTGNTTAKVTYHHSFIYDKMTNRFGVDYSGAYVESQHKSFEKYRDMCKAISCDYKECNSFVYSVDSAEKIENEVSALQRLGCKATFEDSLPLPFKVAGAVRLEHQAQFNPLKFVSGILKDISLSAMILPLYIRIGKAYCFQYALPFSLYYLKV